MTEPHAQTTQDAVSSASDVALAAIAAVEERDRDKLFAVCHDEIEFHESSALPYGGMSRGKDHLREQLERSRETTWLGTWGPLQPTEREPRMDPRVVASSADEVVIEYRQRALAPNGERFDAPVLALYRVRDGRLARPQMFHFDTHAIVRFLEHART